jgi:hypothetical protein
MQLTIRAMQSLDAVIFSLSLSTLSYKWYGPNQSIRTMQASTLGGTVERELFEYWRATEPAEGCAPLVTASLKSATFLR